MTRLRWLLGAILAGGVAAFVACDEGSPALPTLDSPPRDYDATLPVEASPDAPGDSTAAEGGDGASDAADATVDGDAGTTDGPDGAFAYPPFSCGSPDGGADADAADAGAPDGCAVSWTVDLFSAMQAGAIYDCASALCHGSGLPGRPFIDTTDAATTYENFAAFTVPEAGGLPVILPGSTDPTKSVLECLLRRSCPWALRPMPPGNHVSVAYLGKVDGWICCGAPFN